MKRNISHTIFSLMALWLSLAAAPAQDSGACSPDLVAGKWGYSETGTLYLPTGAVPYASLGSYALDADGNLTGARNASVGGTIQPATIKGTATVNADCTGTLTLSFYDQAGNLSSTAVKVVVYVDNAREARAMITSVQLANGTSLQAVLTTNAKKMFPDSGSQQ